MSADGASFVSDAAAKATVRYMLHLTLAEEARSDSPLEAKAPSRLCGAKQTEIDTFHKRLLRALVVFTRPD